MKREWLVYPGYFPKQVCELILSSGLEIPPQQATIGIGAGQGVDEEFRQSTVRFLNTGPDWMWLISCLWNLGTNANREFGFELNNLSFLQLAEYKAENAGKYDRHQDVFWVTKEDKHRKLSCVVQLSDPDTYEGGNFELYDAGNFDQDIRQQGTIIYFPSFYYHAALPVTSGVRHSMAAWYEGPKFR